jgi:D-psicose/D-tagatose/L-ribulose 3-epimerase
MSFQEPLQMAPLQMALNLGVWTSGWDLKTLPGLLDRGAALGYTHVVVPVRVVESMSVELAADAVASACERSGLAPLCSGSVQADVDISSDDAEVRAAGARRLRTMVAIAADLGADQLGGVLYAPLGDRRPVPPERFRRTAELLGEVAEHAHDNGVQLAFEVLNRYETAIVNTVGQALDLIAASGSSNLRIHLDTYHMALEEADLIAATVRAVPYLAYLELEQSNRGGYDQGWLPLGDIIEAAFTAGYTGKVGMEAFSSAVMDPATATKLSVWRPLFGADNTLAEDAIGLARAAYARAASRSG